jgi:hypothetical protein
VALPGSPRDPPISQQQEERKLSEEAERAEKERKEAEEWAAKEEAERDEAKEREKERLRLEEGRAQREAEQKVRRHEAQQDRLRKLKEEEEAKRATEERHRAEEEALRAAEAGEGTGTFADVTSVAIPEKSKIKDKAGEVRRNNTTEESIPSITVSVPTPVAISTELQSNFTEELIGTPLPSPELPRNNFGSRNLQTTITNNSTSTSPSALSTARHIDDINRITYPEGVIRPKIGLNIDAQKGKFRYVLTGSDISFNLNSFHASYDRDFLLQFMNICKEKPDNLSLLDVIEKSPVGPHNFQTRNIARALPSTPPAARHVEDIKNPKDVFDVDTQEGKFWYVPSAFQIQYNLNAYFFVSRAGTASVVPIESLLSDPYVEPPFTPKVSRIRFTSPGTSPASFLGMGSSESETPDTSCWQSDDSFVQHSKYFFKDGNVTFLVRRVR